jgi:hypothetical protein
MLRLASPVSSYGPRNRPFWSVTNLTSLGLRGEICRVVQDEDPTSPLAPQGTAGFFIFARSEHERRLPAILATESPFCITQQKLEGTTSLDNPNDLANLNKMSAVSWRGVRPPQDILGQGVGRLADRFLRPTSIYSI